NAKLEDPKAGAVQVAATATDLHNGTFRYVYVMMNHDFDPKVGSFSVPIDDSVTVDSLKFSDGDSDVTNDWTLVRSAGVATWTPGAAAAQLEWGTALTISFVANVAPTTNAVSITRGDNGEVFAIRAIVAGPHP